MKLSDVPVPTQEQLVGLLRQAMTAVGSALLILGYPASFVDDMVGDAMKFGGPALVLVSLSWSMWAKRRAGLVARASAVDGVKKMGVSKAYLVDAVKAGDPNTQVELIQV